MAHQFTLQGLLSQGATAISPYVDYLVNDPLRQMYNAAVPATNFLAGTHVSPIPLAGPPLPVKELMRKVEDVLGTDKTYVPELDRYPPSPDGTPRYRTYTGSDTPINVPQRPIPPMVQPVQMSQPVQPQSPAEAGIQKGGIAGLLGGAITRMMDRALYSTPTFGGNFITEQAGGEVALRRMESAAAQKEQEAFLKAAKIQADSAKDNKVKPSAEVSKIYDSIFSAQKGLETINEIKKQMSKAITTGGAAAGLNAINNIAAAFNINLGKTGSQSLQNRVAELRKQLIASRAFGREANKDEQRIIRELIPDPGIFTNIDQLEKAYANVASELQDKLKLESGKLSVYGLPRYSDVKRDVPLFTRNK